MAEEKKEKPDLFESVKKEDGSIDEQKVKELLAQKQREVDILYKESKKRGEKLKSKDEILSEREVEIAERESKIKGIEESKLKEDEKFQELLALKEKEIEKLKGTESKVKELEAYKKAINDQQIARIDSKVNELSEKNRELYEAASSGMADDAYSSKLIFLEKLTNQLEVSGNNPSSGGRDTVTQKDSKDMDEDELMKIKEKNPELFQSMLKEQMRKM